MLPGVRHSLRPAPIVAALVVALLATPALAGPGATGSTDFPPHTWLGGERLDLTPSEWDCAVLTAYGPDEDALWDALKAADLSERVAAVRFVQFSPRAMLTFTEPVARDPAVRERLRALEGVVDVRDVPRLPNGSPALPTARLVVGLRHWHGPDYIHALVAGFPVKVERRLDVVGNAYELSVTEGWQSLDVANALAGMAAVEWAEPQFARFLVPRFRPNDTYYSWQWHLRNTGSFGDLMGGGRVGADVKAEGAWDIHRGTEAMVIAICDDGMDLGHPDLNQVAGYDYLDMDNTPSHPSGCQQQGGSCIPYGHGTSVGGVAAARGNNGAGVTGLCMDCRVMPIRLIGSRGVYDTTIADAFAWARDYGAKVINNSWGHAQSIPASTTLRNAIYNITRDRNGVVFVWAAGNESRQVAATEVEGLADVLTGGSPTENDTWASYYSNYGTPLDVLAPSNGGRFSIATTDARGAAGYNNNGTIYQGGYRDLDTAGNYTWTFGGTSSAAPLVAGLVGLIRSLNPSLSALATMEIVRNTADQVDRTTCAYSTSGHSTRCGYGRANAQSALAATSQGIPCGTVTSAGYCEGNTAYFCNANRTLEVQDCLAQGKKCKTENGQSRCVACVPDAQMSCRDNRDNDCDEFIDDPDECIPGVECFPTEFTPVCEGSVLVGCLPTRLINRVDCTQYDMTCGLDFGEYNCVERANTCQPTPTSSCRDSVDNNCDRNVDELAECRGDECIPEGFPSSCSGNTIVRCTPGRIIERVACAANQNCVTGASGPFCEDKPPDPTCRTTDYWSCTDAIDNDCDGAVDDEAECDRGECLVGRYRPTCNGTVLRVCRNGRLAEFDCLGAGLACGQAVDGQYRCLDPFCVPTGIRNCTNGVDDDCNGVADDSFECPAAPCDPATERGSCWGTQLQRCSPLGLIERVDCGAQNRVCATIDTGAACVEPPAECTPSPSRCDDRVDNDCDGLTDEEDECPARYLCGTVTMEGYCDGNAAVFCGLGGMVRADCGTVNGFCQVWPTGEARCQAGADIPPIIPTVSKALCAQGAGPAWLALLAVGFGLVVSRRRRHPGLRPLSPRT